MLSSDLLIYFFKCFYSIKLTHPYHLINTRNSASLRQPPQSFVCFPITGRKGSPKAWGNNLVLFTDEKSSDLENTLPHLYFKDLNLKWHKPAYVTMEISVYTPKRTEARTQKPVSIGMIVTFSLHPLHAPEHTFHGSVLHHLISWHLCQNTQTKLLEE